MESLYISYALNDRSARVRAMFEMVESAIVARERSTIARPDPDSVAESNGMWCQSVMP
jgi:hypothetical protein